MDRDAILLAIQAAGYGTGTAEVVAQNKAIDTVFLELAAEREWSWLFTTTTGTFTVGSGLIANPSDLAVPKGVFPSYGTITYDPLTEISAEEMRVNQHLDLGTGLPAYWAWVNRTIAVWPYPDVAYAYRLDYIKQPTTTSFDQGTESAPFNIQFHPVIIWGALRWLAYRDRDAVAFATARDEYTKAKLNFSQADRFGDQQYVKQWSGWD